MQYPLISVIIPVYNVENYLCQCLDSVLNSTYNKLQIILVDDGSADNCGSICDVYADKDQRIDVIHQKNQGLAEARNRGMSIAAGDYIAFVDSDDIVSPTLFETLLWAIQHTSSDIAACEFTRTDDTMAEYSTPSSEHLRIIDGTDACIRVFSGEPSTRSITWTGPMVWNKLYRKEKITAAFRTECLPAEDMQFNWEYAQNCSKMVIVPQALYYWRINQTSITHSFDVTKYVSTANVWINMAQKADSLGEVLQAHLRYRAANSSHVAVWKIVEHNLVSEYLDFYHQAMRIMKQYFREFISHKDTTFRTGVPYTICRCCSPIWKLLPKGYKLLKRVCKK